MSIFPAVDLVTDVAQAADPLKRSAALSRLGELASARPQSSGQFSTFVEGSRRSSESAPLQTKTAIETSGSSAGASLSKAASTAKAAKAAETFEAFVIQSCIETILPKSETGLFGHGAAGSTWRSMLAEQIGGQIAKGGGFGMKSLLVRDLEHRSGADAAPTKAAV